MKFLLIFKSFYRYSHHFCASFPKYPEQTRAFPAHLRTATASQPRCYDHLPDKHFLSTSISCPIISSTSRSMSDMC